MHKEIDDCSWQNEVLRMVKSQESFCVAGTFYFGAWRQWTKDGQTKEPKEYLPKGV